jgi:hypothetical protein
MNSNTSIKTIRLNARKEELSAKFLEELPQPTLVGLYQKCNGWYSMLSMNRAKITLELMNRGILKTYKMTQS